MGGIRQRPNEKTPMGQFVATNFIRTIRATHVVNTPDSVTFPSANGKNQNLMEGGKKTSTSAGRAPQASPSCRLRLRLRACWLLIFSPPTTRAMRPADRPTEPAQRGRDQPPLAIKSHSIFSHDGMGYLHSKNVPPPPPSYSFAEEQSLMCGGKMEGGGAGLE